MHPAVPELGQNGRSSAVGVDPGAAHPVGRPVASTSVDAGLVAVAAVKEPTPPVASAAVVGDTCGDDGGHGVPLAGSIDSACGSSPLQSQRHD